MKRKHANHRRIATTAVAGGAVAALSLFGLAGAANAATPAVPFGALDAVTAGVGTAQVSGWAIEPDTTSPINVQVFVDGVFNQTVHPGFGALHGFSATLTGLSSAAHTVTAYAINTDGIQADNTLLGSQNVAAVNTTSFGAVDVSSVVSATSLRVAGWAIDPKTSAPINVAIYVDGVGVAVTSAASPRADVASVYPTAGANHGYDVTVPVTTTGVNHVVDVYAIDSSDNGNNPLLGESNTMVSSTSIGSVDLAAQGSGTSIEVAGWAFDPKTTAPINVAVYVDGAQVATVNAASSRSDVAAIYPSEGANHGYDVTVPVSAGGSHVVDVYAIDSTLNGNNPLLERNTVTVATTPFGSVDVVAQTTGDNVQVSGWAIDPKTSSPINVAVYVDGVANTVVSANQLRSDVGAVYPSAGANHGFSVSVPIATIGAHTVDVYAIDSSGNGNNPLLAHNNVTVTAASPL
jgi:hypothetical protein